jgi:signal transduction histidine kinase
MADIKTKHFDLCPKKIFSSVITLNYKNPDLEDLYYTFTYTKYTYKTLILPISLIILQLYNTISSFLLINPKTTHTQQQHISIQVYSILVLLFSLLILIYMYTTRNKSPRYIKLFYLFTFNNIMYVFSSMRLTLIMAVCTGNLLVYDLNHVIISYVIVISVLFICIIYVTWDSNNYLYFMVSKIVFVIVSYIVGLRLTDYDDMYCLGFMGFLACFHMIVGYIIIKFTKKMFYFKSKLAYKNFWLNNTLDNIQSGVIKLNKNKITYMNKYLTTKLKFLIKQKSEENSLIKNNHINQINHLNNTEIYNSSNFNIINNNSSKFSKYTKTKTFDKSLKIKKTLSGLGTIDYNDLYLDLEIFKNLEHKNNKKVSQEVLKSFDTLSFEEILDLILNENRKSGCFDKFQYLGIKTFRRGDNENVQILELHLKIEEKGEGKVNYEIIFNDVTKSSLIKETEAKFKYKSLFLAKIAHEFKNPLLGIIELISQTRELEVSQNHQINSNLQMCGGLCSYMLMLIKDFEVIGKGDDTSQININKSEFKLEEEMKFIINIVQTLLKIRHQDKPRVPVTFNFECDKDIPAIVDTDKVRLKQILINILSNSVKFTNQGYIELSIRLEKNNLVLFTVKDTGIGIPKSHAADLFKPYVKCNYKNNNYGSGLGLNIARDLCNLLGGNLTFDHNEPSGCIFSFAIDIISHDFKVLSNNSTRNYDESIPIPKKRESLISQLSSNTIVTNTALNFPYEQLKSKLKLYKLPGFEDACEESIIPIREQNIYAQNVNITNFKNYSMPGSGSNPFPLKYKIMHYTGNNEEKLSNGDIEDFVENISAAKKLVTLIVDDDPLVRGSTIRTLMKYISGLKIEIDVLFIEATDGIECLYTIYKANIYNLQIDFIMTDETMKYMSGSDWVPVFDTLVRSNVFLKIPVYVLTGYDMDDTTLKSKMGYSVVSATYVKPLMNDKIKKLFSEIKL